MSEIESDVWPCSLTTIVKISWSHASARGSADNGFDSGSGGSTSETNSSRAEISGSVCFDVPNPETAPSRSRSPTVLTTDGILDGSGGGPGSIFSGS